MNFVTVNDEMTSGTQPITGAAALTKKQSMLYLEYLPLHRWIRNNYAPKTNIDARKYRDIIGAMTICEECDYEARCIRTTPG